MSAVLDAHIADRNAELVLAFENAPDKQQAIDPSHYLDIVLAERAPIYAAHVVSMDLSPEDILWSMGMKKRYKSSYVRVWYFIGDWITAFLILRYGEEPRAYDEAEVMAARKTGRAPNCSTDPSFAGWPLAFNAGDITRMQQLLKGKNWPKEFALLPVEG